MGKRRVNRNETPMVQSNMVDADVVHRAVGLPSLADEIQGNFSVSSSVSESESDSEVESGVSLIEGDGRVEGGQDQGNQDGQGVSEKGEDVFLLGYWLDERGVLHRAENESDARQNANGVVVKLREVGPMEGSWYLESLVDAVACEKGETENV